MTYGKQWRGRGSSGGDGGDESPVADGAVAAARAGLNDLTVLPGIAI